MNMINKLVNAIQSYYDSISNHSLNEEEVNRLADMIEIMSPNSRILDLMHHGDRMRSVKEIAEEAALREKIWAEGGDKAVLLHIANQAERVMNDIGRLENERYFAERAFNDAVDEMERLKNE